MPPKTHQAPEPEARLGAGSPLDKPLAVTFFKDAAAGAKWEEQITLRSLAARINAITAARKAALPWLKLGRFGDLRSDKNSLRHDANMLAVTGIEADYDGGGISFERAVELLARRGIAACVYTSPSHTEERPRWRVLCPFAQELPPGRRAHMLGRLNGLFGGIFAAESFTLSQAYYFGSVNQNPAHSVELVDGTPIDQRDDLDEMWAGKPATQTAGNGHDRSHTGPLDEAALMAEIVSGTSFHTAAVRLLGRWAFLGVPMVEARKRLVDAFESVFPPDRDERWQRRYADIDRCVEDVYGREAKKRDEAEQEQRPKPEQQDGKSAGKTDDRKPVIRMEAGKVDRIATEAEDALIGTDADIFQRADHLVRPGHCEVSAADGRTTIAAGLHVLNHAALIEELTRAATWLKRDGRSRNWKAIDPPGLVAQVLAARAGRWRFRSIAGVVTCPTLRPDGSILLGRGYDPATRFYHMPDPSLRLLEMPDRPRRDDAVSSLALLIGLLRGFPFVAEPDQAVALSLIVSAVIRGALGMVPVHAFTAPAPGTGKSYLADVTSAIISGRFCPVITLGHTEEELEKRLGAMLLAGYPIISLDNVSSGLAGDALCQVAERPLVRIRILGKSETPECEFRGIITANGNNLTIEGDMTRRAVVGKLDANMERPEEREFGFDPVRQILADRGSYVAAAMTVVRAYLAAGQPGKLRPLASYGAWSDLVRSALVWLGCADPIETMKEARDSDPMLTTLRTVLEFWRAVFGEEGRTAQQVAAALS
jgi:putative DNA primase/helicase